MCHSYIYINDVGSLNKPPVPILGVSLSLHVFLSWCIVEHHARTLIVARDGLIPISTLLDRQVVSRAVDIARGTQSIPKFVCPQSPRWASPSQVKCCCNQNPNRRPDMLHLLYYCSRGTFPDASSVFGKVVMGAS